MPGMDVDSFVFADGTVKSLVQSMGTAGNDSLIGSTYDDTMIGGKGNDTMDGWNGKDTFRINQGDGADTLYGGADDDTLQFGSGITWNALTYQHSASVNLIINVPGGGTVSIPHLDVERVVFSDGTMKSLDDIIQATMKSTSGNDTIFGYDGRDDVISGGNGNDVIDALNGNDSISGGAGNDTIQSGWGDDTIYGGEGADKLFGSWDGRDLFVYRAVNESNTALSDTIYDFNDGLDHIDLRGLGFSSVGAGTAVGTKLGFSYNAGTNFTTLTSANGLKIMFDGQINLDAGDFFFA